MKVCRNFLGYTKTDKYQQIILSPYKSFRFNMTLKIHFLIRIWISFLEILDVSVEHVESFSSRSNANCKTLYWKMSIASPADYFRSIHRETLMETMKKKKN